MEGDDMLDVCLLGTSGMLPLPGRWLTSLMTRYNGSSLLIDCGEGTQIAIKEKGWGYLFDLLLMLAGNFIGAAGSGALLNLAFLNDKNRGNGRINRYIDSIIQSVYVPQSREIITLGIFIEFILFRRMVSRVVDC
jgi:hypothetical protein